MTVKNSSPHTGEPLELERFLPYRLNVLAEAVSRSLAERYADRYNISVPEWRVIAALGQHGTMTATAVGHNSRMHKTKVSRAVSQLTAKGLVEREPNAADMRESFLQLTARGRETYAALVPLAQSFVARLLECLNGEEVAQLNRLMDRLQERAQKLQHEQDGIRPKEETRQA